MPDGFSGRTEETARRILAGDLALLRARLG